LSILDEFTRECLGILVATSIRAEDVIALLQTVLKKRPAPTFLRSDNGSEFTAQAVQDWLSQNNVGPAFIPPGKPWKNGFVESFHDKFRDECLQREWFQSLLEAKVVIEKWRLHYNTQRPHSSLAYQTPANFAAQFTIQPAQSLIPVGYKN
jgi:putative transposase